MCTVSALFRDQLEPTVGDLGAYLERAEAELFEDRHGPGFFLWMSDEAWEIAESADITRLADAFPSARRGGVLPFGRLTGPLLCALMQLAARAPRQGDLYYCLETIDTRELALDYLQVAARQTEYEDYSLSQPLRYFFVPIRWALLRLIRSGTHTFTSFDLEVQVADGVWENTCALVWEERRRGVQ